MKQDIGMQVVDNTQLGREENALHPISMDYLYAGMEVIEDIYNYNGKLLLIPKGDILSEASLHKLKKFNSGSRNINVFVTTYNMLMNRGAVPASFDQHYTEENIGYTQVKDKANDLLKQVEQGKGILRRDTDEIVSSMSEQLETIDRALIFQCINAQKPISEYLHRHCINVGLINGLIGKWLELPKKDVDELILAGLVHDIGKTKIPGQILDAPRRLTVTEFEVMKMHPIYSQELLQQDNRFSEAVRLAARHHHEKVNGSGYPDGINISDISLFARITAVSDIYDAMVSRRSYKDGSNPFSILSQLAGSQFSELDIRLVKVFTDNMPKELVGKSVLLSDGSTGIAKFIMNNDLEHPLVEIDGVLMKTGNELHCMSMIFGQ